MEVVKTAAAYVREQHENRQGLTIEEKGRQNFVTQVDKEAEKILVSGLAELLPEAGFIAEEGTNNSRGERFNWVIDPIDGTTNFIHGVFPFAISVGLTAHHEVVAGIVYEFGLDEFFYAWKGGGAWLNGSPVRVSEAPRVEQALIATGFPYTNFKYLEQFMQSMDHLCITRTVFVDWVPLPQISPMWPADGMMGFMSTGSIPGMWQLECFWSERQVGRSPILQVIVTPCLANI